MTIVYTAQVVYEYHSSDIASLHVDNLAAVVDDINKLRNNADWVTFIRWENGAEVARYDSHQSTFDWESREPILLSDVETGLSEPII